ncbi:hypothetical protein [Rhodococcus marinonascens]|nr:hypothetical protein [Rhodococcus marinonascens]
MNDNGNRPGMGVVSAAVGGGLLLVPCCAAPTLVAAQPCAVAPKLREVIS